jgi:hypothetical protein
MKTSRTATIAILSAATLGLGGCHTTPVTVSATTSPAATTSPTIDLVRNGYLKYNKTTTVGNALEHTFSNGTWKSFTTDKGTTIVEFDGSYPFKECIGSPSPICSTLAYKIMDACKTDPTVVAYNILSRQLNDAQEAVNSAQNTDNVSSANATRDQLKTQLDASTDPGPACATAAETKAADLPVPMTIQFSLNADHTTFQYVGSDLALPDDQLFEKIYN